MTVLNIVKTIRESKGYKFWPFILGFLYGVALPLGSYFLKQAAMTQKTFLMVSDPEWAAGLFWGLTLFTVGVSLNKVFHFLYDAYKSRCLAFLACVGFEASFIAVENPICSWFFFGIVALANIMQAMGGFLDDSPIPQKITDEKIKSLPAVNQPANQLVIGPEPEHEAGDERFWQPERVPVN